MGATESDPLAAIRGRRHPGLGIFLVPGYPDWQTFEASVEQASARGVTFVEFPLLTELDWSARTGALIAQCLGSARDCLVERSEDVVDVISGAPASVGVAYGSAWPQPDEWTVDRGIRDALSALLLEPSVTDWPRYAAAASRWGCPLIPAVDGRVPDVSDEDAACLHEGGGFVYVSLGGATGERSAKPSAVRAKLRAIRSIRPDLPLYCAFGITDGDDAQDVLRETGCDGVIIGTAAIAAQRQGKERFEAWLDDVLAGLHRGSGSARASSRVSAAASTRGSGSRVSQ